MAYSNTNRLALPRPLSGQGFERQKWYDTLTLLDSYPGVYPCTSGTRPGGWGANQAGMFIIETDTGLIWRWSGTAFVRQQPKGLLADPAARTADFSTANTTPDTAISLAVTVPATTGGSTTKRIKIEGFCYAVENGTTTTLGVAELSIMRDAAVLCYKRVTGRPNTDTDYLDFGTGHTIVFFDNPAAGSYTYKLCVNSIAGVGGTTVLKASATQPAQLAVSEVGL